MICVQNVYHMLAYAFRVLQEQGYRNLGTEQFENTADLLAEILCRGVATQIKRGLGRQYLTREDALTVPRGKILVTESIKTGAIYKKQLYCAYDAYSVDCDGNRILKTTMEYLLRANIAGSRKKELKRLLLYFSEVTTVDRHGINWKLRYDRSNQTYRMLIGVCQLVLKGLLQTNRDGSVRIMDYLDDQTMPRLYEKFILNYFKREHPELKAYSPQIPWQLDDGLGELLPSMQSDIVLKNQNTQKTLIIDAKYYAHNTQAKAPYLSHTIHSGNLYQIFTYVKNWPTDDGQTVSGMLLYAGTDDAVQPHGDYAMSGNAIRVRTLDLNRDFSEIRAQLDEIAGLLT